MCACVCALVTFSGCCVFTLGNATGCSLPDSGLDWLKMPLSLSLGLLVKLQICLQ